MKKKRELYKEVSKIKKTSIIIVFFLSNMEYQQYHDMNLIHFQRFPYDHNNQFHRRDSVQLLPTSQVLRSDDINCEESIQPERGIAGFVSKLYQYVH